MEYQVDLREVLAVATSLSNSGPVIDREITTALTKSGLVVEGRAKELAPYDMGKLRQSITTQVRSDSVLIGPGGVAEKYGPTMEFGREKGKPMPPPGALVGWLIRNNMDPKLDYVIRRSIARKGIAARRYMRDSLEQNKPRIDAFFQEAARNIVNQVVRK